MLHAYLADAKFWALLLRVDEELCAQARAGGCPYCGAALHGARYPRKPRGVPRGVLGEAYGHRLSLCCAAPGCRRRTTPPSVRFFARRVYLGALVVLVAALAQGAQGRQRAALLAQCRVSGRTLARWRRWWREVFPSTRWWRGARGQLVRGVDVARLPAALLECFVGDQRGGDPRGLLAALRFLRPLSCAAEQAR